MVIDTAHPHGLLQDTMKLGLSEPTPPHQNTYHVKAACHVPTPLA